RVLTGMNHFDALGYVFPNDKFRSIRRSVQRNDDLELALRIVQGEAIPQLGFNGLPFVVRRNNERHRWLPVLFFHRPRRDTSPQQENSGIAEVDVEHECEAEPEERFYNIHDSAFRLSDSEILESAISNAD